MNFGMADLEVFRIGTNFILQFECNIGILIFNFFFEGEERKQRDVNEVRDIRF